MQKTKTAKQSTGIVKTSRTELAAVRIPHDLINRSRQAAQQTESTLTALIINGLELALAEIETGNTQRGKKKT